MTIRSTWGRGAVAGAVGTVVLDTVTYLDMALRQRPASDVPQRTAEAGLDAVGLSHDDERGEAAGALAGAAWVGAGGLGRTLAGGLVAAELAADKLPQAPSRLEPQGSVPRAATASLGAAAIAGRSGVHADLPLVAGVAGAAVGATLGALWRERSTLSPTASAVAEDAVALGLAALAVRGLGRRSVASTPARPAVAGVPPLLRPAD